MGSALSSAMGSTAGIVGTVTGMNQQGLASGPQISQQNLIAQLNDSKAAIEGNVGNQNAFAKALQTQMNGGGPNLAGSLLSNATGTNVANQAALMASQRGTGSNAGLIARQAANQGANIQQQAAGQAAAQRQSQQLSAQQGLGNVYGQIGQEVGNQYATQQQALANQNQAVIGGTQGTNQINAGIGQSNINNRMSAFSGAGSTAASAQGSGGSGGGGGDMMAGGGAEDAASMFAAKGGTVPKYTSDLEDHYSHVSQIFHPHMHHNEVNDEMSGLDNEYAKGGKVNAMVSPGERFLKPEAVKKVAEGKADPIESGEKIPGKPKVPGAVDSYKNDTVHKKLEEGGIVIPRHVTMGPDPKKAAFAFVVKELGKKKVKK